jgi:outer membrane protein assembly factor BamE (lipoprotein component of BamABCDE complex)
MKLRLVTCVGLLSVVLVVSGCQSAAYHGKAVRDAQAEGDRLSVGTVQREIRVGMTGAEVAQVLGSPNIVSTDEHRREVWIYDRIATDRVYSTSEGGASVLVIAGALVGSALVGGAPSGYYGSAAGAQSTSQRTLTVIIKFDEDGKVRDFAYHTSRF